MKNSNFAKIELLKSFLADTEELKKLDSTVKEFNIFEAIGVIRQELRHSDFLAFLLDPKQSHALGDTFAKRLLQKSIPQSCLKRMHLSATDFDLWDLNEVSVKRESSNVDILIQDDVHQFIVIIENKIFSGEHSDQLNRYWQEIESNYPEYMLLGLFLTPDNSLPSDERYIPIDYNLISQIADEIANSRALKSNQEVATLMKHYAQMLRKHIMEDQEIKKLCQQIYSEHRQALDLIFEYKPDLQDEIKDFLGDLIEKTPGIILDHITKTWIYFLPASWDLPRIQSETYWTPTQRMLLFAFGNEKGRLHLKLLIGPGEQDFREHIFKVANKNSPPFRSQKKNAIMAQNHQTIFVRNILNENHLENAILEDIKPKIIAWWRQFTQNDLPKIQKTVLNGIKSYEITNERSN